MGTQISQSLIDRVVTGVKYIVSGVNPTNWFGPNQPLPPVAQDDARGRAFDFRAGQNLTIQPRSGEAVSFQMLRALADGYDLLRLVIETRKDQIEAFDWEIVPKDRADSAEKFADDIARVLEFMGSPDKEHDWPQWLRMQIEDLLVIDAIAVYPRPNKGGDLYGFELIDPATLKRVIDVTGRTPLPPDVAYQQVLHGIPAVDYSRDEIVYKMRNPRTNRIYGYSPVEQILMTVNIALRRQISQLDFYTAGNIPEAIAQVPETWTSAQLKDFQTWWDSLMEGQSAQKRKMRFIPMLKDIFFPKREVLKDEYDEWLARIVCFAFSISPTAFIKQTNRATAEQAADTAKEEGLMPLLRFVESHVTGLIQKYLGVPGLRFQFKVVNRVNPVDQATIHKTYIETEVMTPDEVREDLNMDAMTPEQRDAAFPLPAAFEQTIGPGGVINDPGAKNDSLDTTPSAKVTEPTAAEKMLSRALEMLDPATLTKLLIERVRAEPPQIIEFRPETNIEVGDTNVHVPVPRAPVQDPALTKRANDNADLVAAVTKLAEREINVNVEPAAVTVNTPEVTVNVAAPEVTVNPPAINVSTPAVTVDARSTVNVPERAVTVNVPEPGASEEIIQRDPSSGEVVRVVKKPMK